MGLLDPVKELAGVLSGLALVGSLFKPIPDLVGDVQSAVNGLGLLPFGLRLDVQQPHGMNATACAVSYAAPNMSPVAFAPYNETLAGIYRHRQQQAVNLGGWFVNEAWLSPSLFACAANNQTSELDLASGFGSVDTARQAMEQHWDTYIDTDADFAYLSSIGINTLRLPIGFWSLGPDFINGTAYEPVAAVYTNAWPRIQQVIAQAAKHDLGVLVDLHGATASQNGLTSSGFSDGAQSLFDDPVQTAATQKVLTFLAAQLAGVSNVVGIELLNEPSAVPSLESFYTTTIDLMRKASPEAASLPLYVSDSFDLARLGAFTGQRSDFVVLDHHSYFVYDPAERANATSSAVTDAITLPTTAAATAAPALEAAANATHRNIIVGEFSCALSNSSLASQSEPLNARRRYCSLQSDMYANLTAGWAFWNYKVESCEPGWCFRSAVGTALPNRFSAWATNSTAVPGAFDASGIQQKIADIQQKSDEAILADKRDTVQFNASPSASGSASVARSSSAVSTSFSASTTASVSASAASDTASATSSSALEKRHRGLHHARYSGRYRPRIHPRDFALEERDGMTPEEQAIVDAYSLGFSTAKSFAQQDNSKLGFVSQFISDAVAAQQASGQLQATYAGVFGQWMRRGLEDAEAQIQQLYAQDSGAAQRRR